MAVISCLQERTIWFCLWRCLTCVYLLPLPCCSWLCYGHGVRDTDSVVPAVHEVSVRVMTGWDGGSWWTGYLMMRGPSLL
jgi:hypothetical protein